DLDNVEFHQHPIFKIWVPNAVPGVPTEILDPVKTWSDSQEYEKQAKYLAKLFVENFSKYVNVPEEVTAAGPVVD
ncbi:phosphoenolpyruvate carboxykinase (ATP), partial [Limnoraphis robusta]|nr:phosphoenolpyruvate carboxykinase (ATP) [Limnoraphis robusta]